MGFPAVNPAPVNFSTPEQAGAPPSTEQLRSADNGLVGMALFVGTEMMLFAGFISAFWKMRQSSLKPLFVIALRIIFTKV